MHRIHLRNSTSDFSHKIFWLLWGILLLTIPFTSFPSLSRFSGHSTVSPLAALPLLFLIIGWLIPYLLKGRKLPALIEPLLLFVSVALLACVLAPFYKIYPFQGKTVIGREVRSLVTLAIGLGFYLVAARFPRKERDLHWSLILIYLGGVIILVWASLQAYYMFQQKEIPYQIREIHRVFSIRDIAINRVTGFAFEPSWLADQLVLLYLPLWLASVLNGYSVFGRRLKIISLELLLLIWGVIILFLSFSRIGLIAIFTSTGILGAFAGWRIANGWIKTISERWSSIKKRSMIKGLHIIIWTLLMLLAFSVMVTIIYSASLIDPRLEKIFETGYIKEIEKETSPIYSIANKLAYAERVIYWDVSFKVFSKYPLLGVGLGNTGLFYQQYLPAYGYLLPEMVWIVEGKLGFPNPKNLWARLLSETGIVGFLLFMIWLILLAFGAWRLHKSEKGLRAVFGLAGLLALASQVIEGFSLDSFALPQLWIMLGLLTSAISPRDKDDT
jgi:O-antigen ligase